MDVLLAIEQGNALEFPADVLALKYAQAHYGASEAAASALVRGGLSMEETEPAQGRVALLETRGSVKSAAIMFIGVVSLGSFRYVHIREFALRAMLETAQRLPRARHLAMTLHGVGFGLDETEAALAQVAGIVEGLSAAPRLERVTIVEKNRERVRRVRETLADHFAKAPYARAEGTAFRLAPAVRVPDADAPLDHAGSAVVQKRHVFVAMPFSEEKEDVFWYGIQGPVRDLDFTCERIDLASFTGDIVDQIKQRIDTAALVIADVSGANPNVYLEIGYAWGRGRPTLLLCDDLAMLRFDLKSHRCIGYRSIKQLEARLRAELEALRLRGVF